MLQFYILGDMGSGTKDQINVSKAMKQHMDTYKPKRPFVCGLGDNIYESGCVDVNDKQFKTKFEDPYSNMKDAVKFYMTLGNHDYGYNDDMDCFGNSRSQIEYGIQSQKKGKKWIMPSNYYVFKKQISDKLFVEFFVIDTNLDVCKDEDELYNLREIQLQKMSKKIKASKARWKIVMGHHTWRSVGGHGNAERDLEYFLSTLMKQSPFDVYMCGHDHNKQVIEMKHPDKDALLVVCGTGGKVYNDTKYTKNFYNNITNHKLPTKDKLLFCSQNLGFGYCEATKDDLTFKFYDETMKFEYKHTVSK